MKALRAWWLGVLAIALMAGCGEGSSEGGASSSESARIDFGSPAVGAGGLVSPRVECGAGTIWLPLKWGPVPEDAEELVLYFGRFKRENVEGGRRFRIPFAAVITGIDPAVHRIDANTYPAGANPLILTVNNCPPQRNGQRFLVELFALDRGLQMQQDQLNTDFATTITEDALGTGQSDASSGPAATLTEDALAAGHFTATYAPK